MNRVIMFVVILLLCSTPTLADIFTFNPVFDMGQNNGVETDPTWSWICERGAYQAWFGFDISSIPDTYTIQSATFEAYLSSSVTAQRTLWYEPDDSWIGVTNPLDKGLTELVGTVTDSGTSYKLVTFSLDLTGHDWSNDLGDDNVSLMLTGPLDGAHLCGTVWMSEGQIGPVLTIEAVPVPGAVLLGMIGLSVAGIKLRKHA